MEDRGGPGKSHTPPRPRAVSRVTVRSTANADHVDMPAATDILPPHSTAGLERTVFTSRQPITVVITAFRKRKPVPVVTDTEDADAAGSVAVRNR
jgi:hypothetical protein